jgi:hypothetical protein
MSNDYRCQKGHATEHKDMDEPVGNGHVRLPGGLFAWPRCETESLTSAITNA